MKIEPISRVTISDQVFEQMKQLILQGDWKPGEKLPSENELGSIFQVSRITVRHALQKLTMLGLIDTRSGEGSYIKEAGLGSMMNSMVPLAYLGDNSIRQVLEFRLLVEVEAAGLAAQKATDEGVAQLRELNQELTDMVGNKLSFAKADLDFHYKIAELTGNDLIIATHNILRDIMSTAMDRVVGHLGYEIGIYYHSKLLETIEAHDVERTKLLMREHVMKTLDGMEDEKETL